MKSAKYLVLLGIISIVASACSSAAAEATATVQPTATTIAGSSQEARFYLKSIENNAVQVTAAFARFDEQMSKVWPVKSSLFDALSDSKVSQEIISSMGAIIQLSPPDEFEQEHVTLQSAATAAAEYARQLGQALERRDLGETSVAFANFRVSYQRMLITVSPQLCNALGIRDEPETLCEVRAGAPGTYDAGVEQLFKEFRVEFIPRVTVFPAAMSDEERFDTLAALKPIVEATVHQHAGHVLAFELEDPIAQDADRVSDLIVCPPGNGLDDPVIQVDAEGPQPSVSLHIFS